MCNVEEDRNDHKYNLVDLKDISSKNIKGKWGLLTMNSVSFENYQMT